MTAAAPPVLIVDDHSLVAGALALALRGRGIEAEAVLPADFLPRIDVPAAPGALVLLDLDLGDGLGGATLVPRLRRAGWRVLLVTGSSDERRIAVGVAAGALGPQLGAVRRARRRRGASGGGTAADQHGGAGPAGGAGVVGRGDGAAGAGALGAADPAGAPVVDRIAAGRRPAAIAGEFVVSVATVRTQIRSILAKPEVSSQLEVAALAQSRRG